MSRAEFNRRIRRGERINCACSAPAVRIKNSEPICARCAELETINWADNASMGRKLTMDRRLATTEGGALRELR